MKDHVIAGVSGDDLDIPGYVQSHDPETGEMQWRWYVVPQKKGEPGSETWPNEDAMKHGGGMTWQPITYDPELNLIYVTTGNPQPVIAHKNRAGANLYTGSIVALNPDTGKMVWYFQSSPHDTHDWDSTQTPVLIDGEINGQPRKLLAQAARNGHFFLLDRATGKALVSSEYVKTNWAMGYDAKGQPIPNPAKDPQIDGALVTPNQGGATNWPPPSFSPQTGLFYVSAGQAYSVYYIYDPSDNPQGWGGTDRGGYAESMLQAIDYKTGKVRWSHKWEGNIRAGVLSTAGNVVFTGGPSSDLGRAERDDGSGAVAGAAERGGRERADYLRARWSAVRAGGRGRYAVDVRDEREEIDAGLGTRGSGLGRSRASDLPSPESRVPSPEPRFYPTVNGIDATFVPHSTFSVPPFGVSSIEIVSCSTGAFAFCTRHRRAADFERGVVGNTPLAGLRQLADDQLPLLLARLGVERVGARLQAQRAELQRLVGLQHASLRLRPCARAGRLA